MNNGNSVRILSISDDEDLRLSRELVLKSAQYDVESLASDADFNAVPVGSFEVAIICHSVDLERSARLAGTLRRWNPGIRILHLHPFPAKQMVLFDVESDAFTTPHLLLRTIGSLIDANRDGAEGMHNAQPARVPD
jgi:hypothetical protein